MFKLFVCLILRPGAAGRAMILDDYAQIIMCPRMPTSMGFLPRRIFALPHRNIGLALL